MNTTTIDTTATNLIDLYNAIHEVPTLTNAVARITDREDALAAIGHIRALADEITHALNGTRPGFIVRNALYRLTNAARILHVNGHLAHHETRI